MSHSHSAASRRLFLKQVTALSAMGVPAQLALNLAAMGSASAATAPDYKALVCVFLQGGNDHFNTVLATDPTSWANYHAVRDQAPEPIGLLKDVAANTSAQVATPAWLGGVLPLQAANAQGRSFALHPSLKDMQGMFNTSKRLAILPNIGTLVEPTTKAAYDSGKARLPDPLFSHNDQQSQWQAMAPEGASQGWGGRMADMLASQNTEQLFTAISTSGSSVWLAGKDVHQYHLSPSGAIKYGFNTDSNGVDKVLNSTLAATVLKRHATQAMVNHTMMKDLAGIHQASISAEGKISKVLPDGDVSPYGPASLLNVNSPISGMRENPLAQQFRVIARMIAAAPTLGLKRQVFFVTLPSFDTHADQNRRHCELMTLLNHGMSYFDNVLQQLGLLDRVTTFTASDFGRTFTSNGDGTDHGWGSHQFVMGGAVKGGDLYGTFPQLGTKNRTTNHFDSSPDQLYNGVLLPKTSVAQMGATLGRWFGLNDSQLLDVFPTLSNFSGATDLGFMKA
jgi:uncharacterized protein (DUF1501 family)